MRYRLNRKALNALKLISVLIIVTFVWFHFNTSNHYNRTDHQFSQSVVTHSKTQSNSSKSSDKSNELSINELRETIESINREQRVLNDHTFGPLLDEHLVLLIQVHNRVQYLLALIKSLENTKHINEVLLVFSHDVFDETINSVIRSIKFCKVIQIFYPFSLQLNPNSFPGHSADDCPRDISNIDALRIRCNNADSPDIYGHYREAKYTQTKHHWWWKSNCALDALDITRHYSGHFMFLEEDHYLSPDAIHVWKLMNDFKNEFCEDCDRQVITLGSYSRSISFSTNGDKIESNKWISSQHNMGFIINRKVWNEIKSCAKSFCTYDDYNWDWTLQYVSERCLNRPITTLFTTTPRVYHIGECGLHHRRNGCNNEDVVKTIENQLKKSKDYLFPKKLVLKKGIKKGFRLPKANGGWGDVRDHQLCLNQTKFTFR